MRLHQQMLVTYQLSTTLSWCLSQLSNNERPISRLTSSYKQRGGAVVSCRLSEMSMLWPYCPFCDNCCSMLILFVCFHSCCWISPWSSESKSFQFLLGYVYRGRCEILPCRAGSGPRPSAQPGHSLQRSQAREVWMISGLFACTPELHHIPIILPYMSQVTDNFIWKCLKFCIRKLFQSRILVFLLYIFTFSFSFFLADWIRFFNSVFLSLQWIFYSEYLVPVGTLHTLVIGLLCHIILKWYSQNGTMTRCITWMIKK